MYSLIRNILFRFPAESVHYFAMNSLSAACSIPLFRKWLTHYFSPAGSKQVEAFGLHFKNGIGLAAGFDKNARWLRELEALGFGAVEIGTVTPRPQEGNEKPRLFRLPKDKALINRMGFNNEGVKAVSERLRRWKASHVQNNPTLPRLIIGGNIGKNKSTPNEEAWKDYETCFRELFDVVDYFVVNVSSPNTPGLRELQEKEALRKILSHIQTINHQQHKPKPLLLKIAPDLSPEQVDDVIDLAMELRLDGLVAANTTISRDNLSTPKNTIDQIGNGGLSGAPLKQRATALIRYIHQRSAGSVTVIASGGIFTADDAKEKLEAGAVMVQVWTGFIYIGPAIARKIGSFI